MSRELVTLAAVQPPYPTEETPAALDATQARGLELLKEAAAGNGGILCLPEYFNCIGLAPEGVRDRARQVRPLKEKIAALAAEFRAHIVLPVVEERNGRFFNTSYLYDENGESIFSYDKVHLTLAEKEATGLTPGNDIAAYSTPLGKIGFATCYDAYFPEHFQVLALEGTRLIIFPTTQRSDNPEAILKMVSVRAMDSSAFIVRASYGVRSAEAWSRGKPNGLSCIIHPDGTVLANAGPHEGIARATVNLSEEWTRQRCHGYPPQPVRQFLGEDRRPELYGRIATELE